MAARAPIPLHRALRHLPPPRGLLTLDEVRARLETPSDVFVWLCTAPDGRVCRVGSATHLKARRLSGKQLGVDPARMRCVRADEVRIDEADRPECLDGKSVA